MADTNNTLSPTRTRATWKPGVADEPVPFYGCAGCGAMPEAPVDRAFEGTPEPEEPSEASVR